jgi:hypothetical protein
VYAESPDPERAGAEITGRLLTVGVGIAVAGGLVIVVAHAINALVLDDRFFELNARSEGNFFTWASSSAAFGAAFAAAVHAIVFERHRLRWVVVAVAFAYSSLDDFIRVHERLGQALYTDTLGLSKELASRLEILTFAPLLAAGFLAAWSLSRVQPGRVGTLLRYGLITLAVALAFELVAGSTRLLLDGPLAWIDELRIASEEGLELAGWTVVATALTGALCVRLVGIGRKGRVLH